MSIEDNDLGAPAEDDRPWTERAECRGYDPDLFFPVAQFKAGRPLSPIVRAQVRQAKEMCAICPVRAECLQYALDENEPDGIWGGLTPDERRPLRRGDRSHVPGPLPGTRLRLIDHGTDGGYRNHRHNGEAACPRCLQAHAFLVAATRRSRSMVST
jgi:WhiB family redox-sensing transcriptional regulator